MNAYKFIRKKNPANKSPALPKSAAPFNRFIITFLVLLTCLVTTYFIWNTVNANREKELQSYFEFRAREINTHIVQRIISYEQVLRSTRGFYVASDNVNRKEFSSFFNSLNLVKNYPGSQGVGFSLIIPPSHLKDHIDGIRKEGFPEYKIWPEGKRETYTSIIYLEPFRDLNLRAFGYDMFSEPVRRKAMEMARDSNETKVSGKIILVQEAVKAVQAGFLIYLPVYKNGAPLSNVSERRANIIGWVYSPFRMNDFMKGSFGEHAADIDIEIYDTKNISIETKMYDSNTYTNIKVKQLVLRKGINFRGHEWTVLIKSTPQLESRIGINTSRIILIVGLSISFLLTIITLLVENKRRQTIITNAERELLSVQLNEEINRRRIIFEQSPDGIVVIDPRTARFIEFNTAAHRQLGYTREEFALLSIADVEAKETYEETKSTIARVIKEGRIDFETLQKSKSGEIRNIFVTAQSIDNSGHPVYYCLWRDITERKLAENKLRESETRLKQISEGTEEWIWEVDTNGVFTYVNPYAKKLLGYNPEELIGIKHFYDYFEPEHKEELIQGALAAFGKKESIRNFINCNIHKDGRRIILSTSGFPIIDGENNFIGYRGINVDITNKQKAEDKLKRSEEQLKEAQQVGHIGNWELDVVKNTGTMSDEMYKIFNIDRNSINITIETFLETPIPEDRKMVRELVMKSEEAGEGIDFDFRTITPNGEIRWIHEKSTVELDAKGKLKRIFGTCQDITESKLLQLKLEDSERRTRSLLNANPDMIFRINRDGTYLDYKADRSDLYAQSEQTIIGKKNRDITPPEFADLIDQYIEQTLDSGELQQFEYQMITPKGGLRNYEARMVASGKDEVIAVVRDVTERKLAEEQIHESEYRYRNLFENAGIAIWEEDLSEVRNYINKLKETGIHDFRLYFEKRIDEVIKCASLVKLLDVNKEVLHVVKAKSKEEVITSLPAFFIEESLDAAREEIIALAEGKMRIEGEIPIKIMDGEIRQILFQLTVVQGYEDTWEKVLFSFIDITERKQIEESLKLFRTLLDKSNDAIEVIDLETGQFIDVNERACTDLGYSRNELLSMTVQDIDPFQDKQSFQLLMQDVRQSSSTIVESIHRRKDGSVFPVEINIAVVKIVKTYSIAIVRDVTERKKLETNLSTAAELAKLGYWEFEVKSGNFIFNDQYYRLIHGSSTEIQGGNVMSAEEFARRLVHPDDSKMIGYLLQEAITSTDPEYFGQSEARVFRDNGEIAYVIVHFKVLKDQSGNPITVYGINQDITNRKLAELKLKESEAKLTDAMKIAKLSTWEYDCVLDRFTFPDQSFSLINTTAEHEGGNIMSSEQFAQKYIYPDDRVLIEKEIRKAFETPDPAYTSYMEYRVIYAPGEIGTFAANVRIEKDADNRTIKALGVNQDITDHKLAELKLKESEEQFRSVAQSANDAIITTDSEGIIKNWNRGAEKIFGYLEEEIIGKNLDIIIPQGYRENHIDGMRRVQSGGEHHVIGNTVELHGLHQSGKKFPLELSLAKWETSKGKFFTGIIRDITERKQIEEALRKNELQFRMVWENATDGMRITNETGVVLKANNAYCKLMGKAKGEIEGNMMSVVYEQAAQSEVLRKHGERFRTRSIPQNLNRDILLWNGVKVSLELSNTFLDMPGQQTLSLSVLRDVTERNQAEKEIKVRNEQLVKLNAEKDKFFSIIAHDLRSPFNGLLTLTELMSDSRENFTSEEFVENSNLLNEAANNLYKLLENLLEWAQVQRGSINFTPIDADLSKMVLQSIESVNQRALQKRITINNEIVGTQKVLADEKMIGTVLRNLLTNAIKFTRKGGKVILKSERSNNGTIEVSVEDNGVGMADKNIKRLFKIEEKVSSQGTDGEASTGLGLLLCKEFIEMHGGNILVDSKEGKGSKFSFTLQKSVA